MAEVTKKKLKVSKKPVSEAQRLANIANSRKSRGPVTLAGKNICRYANLQHGLRAATVLPGEEQKYTHRFSTWAEEWGADDDSQQFMVHRAVMSSLKLDRGDVVDVAMIENHKDAVLNEAELRDGDELDRLIAQLAGSPAATIRRLRKTPIGCLWIHEQFLIFQTRLKTHRSLLDSQRRRLCHLLGRRIDDFLRDDITIVPWVVAMVGCLFGGEEVDLPSLAGVFGGQPEGMTAAEFTSRLQELGRTIPDGKKANLALRAHLAEELAKLKEHRELVEALSERNLERDVNQTRIALTPAGKQLEGYVTSQRQSFDSSLRRLAAMQDPRRPRPPGRRPKPGPGDGDGSSPGQTETKAAPREPRAAVGEETPAAVATENEAAVVAEAARGDCEPRVDTTPETPALTEPEAAGASAIEPAGEEITTRPNSAPKSSNEADFDQANTGLISGVGPTIEPAGEEITTAAFFHAGAEEPPPGTDPGGAGSDSPLARATEQLTLRWAELARQVDAHFGINDERPDPGEPIPGSERVEDVPRDPVPGCPGPASMPLGERPPVLAQESANLSPFTKGGYRGVLDPRDPEDPGVEFTPPTPPS